MSATNKLILNEPTESWGGSWTVKKLKAFEEYVVKYLTILNKWKEKAGFKTIYFDGFAGGLNAYKLQAQGGLIEEDVKVYEGSVKRILSMVSPFHFDYYYFIEKDLTNSIKLEEFKKTVTVIPQSHIVIRQDDCNVQLELLAKALQKKQNKALIFLDPFGLQIKWSSIEQLKGTGSDIWILLPSGVAINRLIPQDYNRYLKEGKQSLELLFGMTKEEIANVFYLEQTSQGLFGEEKQTKKVEDSITKIVNLYSEKLGKIWDYVSEPLVLPNSKGAPIFHFIFASNNEAGLKIANHIVKETRRK